MFFFTYIKNRYINNSQELHTFLLTSTLDVNYLSKICRDRRLIQLISTCCQWEAILVKKDVVHHWPPALGILLTCHSKKRFHFSTVARIILNFSNLFYLRREYSHNINKTFILSPTSNTVVSVPIRVRTHGRENVINASLRLSQIVSNKARV